ncbi:MAG: ABC transporter ATP-binding protein [Clostridia bacterium]|nr:ABC transporter ATP-binding protein [Clostridia bacterium]
MKNLLQVKNFNKAFGENVLFTNFGYDFTPGIYVLSGPSGVGKSTLMRIIAGLEKGYTGDIILNGEKLTSTSPLVHMMHQHYMSFPWLNILKNTLMVYKGHKITPTDADVEEAKAVLGKLGLSEHLDNLPGQISGGQDQRLSLASALINKWSPVIMYDEPTSALDNVNDELVVELIKEHQKKYGTIEIVITHEEHVVKGLNATVLELTPEFRLRPGDGTVSVKEPEKVNWLEQLFANIKIKIAEKKAKAAEKEESKITAEVKEDVVLSDDEQPMFIEIDDEVDNEPIVLELNGSDTKRNEVIAVQSCEQIEGKTSTNVTATVTEVPEAVKQE